MKKKLCYRCKKTKITNSFSKDNQKKSKLRTYCKKCESKDYFEKRNYKLKIQKKYRKTKSYKEAHKKTKRKYNKKPRVLFKINIRNKTRRMYGPLPKGYEYHHLTPYLQNNFVILTKEKHRLIHAGAKNENVVN